MFDLFSPSAAWAQAPASGPAPQNPFFGTLFLIVSFVLIFYFLLLRPQQKRQKQVQDMLKNLKTGDRVLTSGGLFGSVLGIKDDVVVLKINDDGVKAEFAKSAIQAVIQK